MSNEVDRWCRAGVLNTFDVGGARFNLADVAILVAVAVAVIGF